jgi:membrane fusion protein (multidrug efflux system)
MDFSRRTLSLVTLALIIVALAAGVWWRLGGLKSAKAAAAGGPDSTKSANLPETSGASEFSTDVPQPVTGAKVLRDTLWISVSASGQAEAYRRATLNAQVEGRVVSLPVMESQRVARGDLLLGIDTTQSALDVATAQANLLQAQARYRQDVLFDDSITDPEVKAQRDKYARSMSGLDQAEVALRKAELTLARTAVRAPFDGWVADVKVVPGQHVTVGAPLMTVVDLDPIKVEVQVLEAELGDLTPGRRATVTFAAYPGEKFHGHIESINPVVDPQTRTGRVTVVLTNRDHRIKPGMYAEISLDAEAIPNCVLVPRSAILERGEGERRTMLFVYSPVDASHGLAKWRYVTVGRENDSLAQILPSDNEQEGVKPGEIVLVDGQQYLAHDTPVRLVKDVQAAGGRPGR